RPSPLHLDQVLAVLHLVDAVDLRPVDTWAAVDDVPGSIDRADQVTALAASDHVAAAAARKVVLALAPDQLVLPVATVADAAVGGRDHPAVPGPAGEASPGSPPRVARLRPDHVIAAAPLDQQGGEGADDVGVVVTVEVDPAGGETEGVGRG